MNVLHLASGADQNKEEQNLDQEYEEISTIESPDPGITRNSVHFILDERATDEFEIPETDAEHRNTGMYLSVPVIEIIPPPMERHFSSPLNDVVPVQGSFGYVTEENGQRVHRHSITNKSTLQENCSDSKPASVTDAPTSKNYSNFAEETGGLTPECSKDMKNTLFFDDGIRRIDLILVYDGEDLATGVFTEEESFRIDCRRNFEESLKQEGLELELVDKDRSFDEKTYFVKIHCPLEVLEKFAARMHMSKPVKQINGTLFTYFALLEQSLISVSVDAWEGREENSFENIGLCALFCRVFEINSPLVTDEPTLHTSIFSQRNQDKLLVKDRERFFTSSQRSQVVWQICLRARFASENNVGIRKLLNNGAYKSAFPLHEGKHDRDTDFGFTYDRRILYLIWAQPSQWYKQQPLWLIRKYYGDKIALYFAWLGFYTNMLILPSIVGLFCFIYGLTTMSSDRNTPSKEICDSNVAGNITLCPLCDTACNYQKLKDSCLFSNLTYLFDNNATVVFSIFMSFWATLFLELWKRKQALIAWQWDLHNLNHDDDTRPEYDLSCTRFKINPVNRRKEPFVPTFEKAGKIILSVIVVSFMIFVVFCFVMVTIMIRLILFTIASDSKNDFLKMHAKIITSTTAAIINLIIIIILTKIYHYVAIWLTNTENPRTKMQFERSFIVKIFLFEFMNYYSSLIYIAFFKGRFFTHPGDSDSRNSIILRLKGDVCDPAGCLSELCIQLAIIMIGKQCFSNVLELLFPAIRNWWRNRIMRSKKTKPVALTHWEENYALQDPGNLALFEEYLEMAIQYGFATLFVAAFPLAPLFALLNNICEIRLDAYKMIAQARRPIAERVENIGAWFSILRGITYCAVVFNAFVIAFTSDYIPRKIYQYFYSENNDLVGYIDSSLSVFNTSDFQTHNNKLGKGVTEEPDTCQYRGYRNGPDQVNAYELSTQYWIIFGARLLFIVIFEHFIFTVTEIISNIIPDVPYIVGRQMHLEKLLMETNIERKFKNRTDGTDKRMDDYDQFLCEIKRATGQDSYKFEEVVRKNTWVRRVSRRISEGGLGSLNNPVHTSSESLKH